MPPAYIRGAIMPLWLHRMAQDGEGRVTAGQHSLTAGKVVALLVTLGAAPNSINVGASVIDEQALWDAFSMAYQVDKAFWRVNRARACTGIARMCSIAGIVGGGLPEPQQSAPQPRRSPSLSYS